MGWTYTHKEKDLSMKEFFTGQFGSHVEILDVAVVKLRTAYMAIKNINTGQVYAYVFLLDYVKNDYYNFGYKDMDETVMPYAFDCPERILNLLTPTENERANEWRKKCWERIKERKNRPVVKDGMKIKFESPISFTNGAEIREFTVRKQGRKTTFMSGYGLYSISNWRERSFEIVGQ